MCLKHKISQDSILTVRRFNEWRGSGGGSSKRREKNDIAGFARLNFNFAGAGGIEPPTAVLETAGIPLT